MREIFIIHYSLFFYRVLLDIFCNFSNNWVFGYFWNASFLFKYINGHYKNRNWVNGKRIAYLNSSCDAHHFEHKYDRVTSERNCYFFQKLVKNFWRGTYSCRDVHRDQNLRLTFPWSNGLIEFVISQSCLMIYLQY